MVSWMQIFREVADMEDQFLNLTEENLDQEHLCCIIRSKKPHPGVEAKRAWLRERLREGHVFRKGCGVHRVCSAGDRLGAGGGG